MCRRLLGQLLHQPNLIPDVCQRLKLTIHPSPHFCNGLAAILLTILQPAWKAVEDAGRNPSLRASFIATAFLPEAFAFQASNEARWGMLILSETRALHADTSAVSGDHSRVLMAVDTKEAVLTG